MRFVLGHNVRGGTKMTIFVKNLMCAFWLICKWHRANWLHLMMNLQKFIAFGIVRERSWRRTRSFSWCVFGSWVGWRWQLRNIASRWVCWRAREWPVIDTKFVGYWLNHRKAFHWLLARFPSRRLPQRLTEMNSHPKRMSSLQWIRGRIAINH